MPKPTETASNPDSPDNRHDYDIDYNLYFAYIHIVVCSSLRQRDIL